MTKEYVVNINNLKISGPPEEIHKLARVYGLAACEYGNQIVDEIHSSHNNIIIADLESEQKEFENIEKQLIDAIRDSNYYKQYSSEMSVMIDDILKDYK